jgi:hypothetical protein
MLLAEISKKIAVAAHCVLIQPPLRELPREDAAGADHEGGLRCEREIDARLCRLIGMEPKDETSIGQYIVRLDGIGNSADGFRRCTLNRLVMPLGPFASLGTAPSASPPAGEGGRRRIVNECSKKLRIEKDTDVSRSDKRRCKSQRGQRLARMSLDLSLSRVLRVPQRRAFQFRMICSSWIDDDGVEAICIAHYPTQVPLAACDIQDGTTFEVAQIKVLQNKRAKARDAISSGHDARCESIHPFFFSSLYTTLTNVMTSLLVPTSRRKPGSSLKESHLVTLRH